MNISIFSPPFQEIIDYKASNKLKPFLKFRYTPQNTLCSIMKFLKFIIKNKIDIIQTQFAIPAGIYGIIGRLFKIPFIVVSHGYDIQIDKKRAYGSRLNFFKAIFIKKVLQLASRHVIVTKSMYNDALEAGTFQEKLRTIYNSIDCARFNSQINGDKIREDYSVGNSFLVLFVGGFRPVKGLEYLIRAVNLLIKTSLNIKVLLVGFPEDLRYYRDIRNLVKQLKLENYVKIVGPIENEVLPFFYAAADLFVLPSLKEGFPTVLLEAMAMGVPVIASKIKGITDIIINDRVGVLFSPGDHIDLSNKIKTVIKDPKLRKIIKVNGEKRIKKYFDLKKMVSHYTQLYQEIMTL